VSRAPPAIIIIIIIISAIIISHISDTAVTHHVFKCMRYSSTVDRFRLT